MKPSLTSAQHVELLAQRGLAISDPVGAERFFDTVGYYRFSGYARYFQRAPHLGDDNFEPGASFDAIRTIYLDDETLRIALLKALTQAEIALRANVSRVIADEYSPYGRYLDAFFYTDLPGYEPTVTSVRRDIHRSKDHHIVRYRDSYGEHADYSTLPIWSAVESWSFGTLSKVIERGAHGDLSHAVALHMGVAKSGFSYRIRSFVYLRNRCAHLSRLWNHSVIDAGPTPNNVRNKAKRLVGQFEARSPLDIIASMDDICLRAGVAAPILPTLANQYEVESAFWQGLAHPQSPRNHESDS